MAETAQPLKVPSTPAKPNAADIDNTPKPSRQASKRDVSKSGGSHEISSPHELTAFVEDLLEKLDTKFDEMSSQILDRMSQMSTRVDALEASIQDIINADVSSGTTSVPQSPTPSTLRKSDSVYSNS
ncbi:heat shock factor binding protein 1-domain-containing protein [Pterulicium gracile]|uniref:Heat shock factor binding protein 1-domain-containing protein n=1 Tax=Pterulicium gracile TaxID=1884261 RepID=A0A5C3Q824_9AGAR|nr:heat shock factor binding protein 1-domain-containing protein [Pterula gracilis]